MTEVSRNYPSIKEINLNSQEHYLELLSDFKKESDNIPLFIKHRQGDLEIIPTENSQVKVAEGDLLVYLGKAIEAKPSEVHAEASGG